MILQMLAIWSLSLLPFLNPAWTSEGPWFPYSWSLAWRILSVTLLAHWGAYEWNSSFQSILVQRFFNVEIHSYHLLLDHFQYHNDMITLLEPDILQCEVKWASGSITINKVSGGDGIPFELFQILKDDAVKVHTQYASKFGKSAVTIRLEKVNFHSNLKEK